MPLGTALASGLQAFTTVREEGRRSRLHDLQVQNYELRNQAQGLNNMFAEDTYDRRVQTVDSQGRSADYKAEKDRVAMLVETAVAPWKVHQAEYDAKKSEQGLYTEQQRTRKEGNLASLYGTRAQVASATANSEIAATNQKNRTTQMEESRKALGFLQDDLAQVIEAHDYDIGAAVNNSPEANGILVGLAHAAGLDTVTDAAFQNGRLFLLDGEGQVVHEASEEDFVATMLDDDAMAEVIQGAEQLRRAEAPHIERANSEMVDARADREADYAEIEDAYATFAKAGPALSDLQRLTQELRDLEARRAEASDTVSRGAASNDPMIGGFYRNAPDLRAEAAELESQIATLTEGLSEMGVSEEYIANPGRLQERIQTLESGLANNQPGGPREQRVQQQLIQNRMDTRSGLRAGLDGEEVTLRQLGSGSSRLSLGDRETIRSTHMAPAEAAGEFVSNVVGDVVASQSQLPAKERDRDLLENAGTAERDLRRLFAVTPGLADMLHNDPNAKLRFESAFRDAVDLQARTGKSSAITLLGAINDDRPEVTAAMHSVLDDHQLLRGMQLTQEQQLELAALAGEQMRQQIARRENLNEDRAVRLALQQLGR